MNRECAGAVVAASVHHACLHARMLRSSGALLRSSQLRGAATRRRLAHGSLSAPEPGQGAGLTAICNCRLPPAAAYLQNLLKYVIYSKIRYIIFETERAPRTGRR